MYGKTKKKKNKLARRGEKKPLIVPERDSERDSERDMEGGGGGGEGRKEEGRKDEGEIEEKGSRGRAHHQILIFGNFLCGFGGKRRSKKFKSLVNTGLAILEGFFLVGDAAQNILTKNPQSSSFLPSQK